jgi:hypothetical protein
MKWHPLVYTFHAATAEQAWVQAVRAPVYGRLHLAAHTAAHLLRHVVPATIVTQKLIKKLFTIVMQPLRVGVVLKKPV